MFANCKSRFNSNTMYDFTYSSRDNGYYTWIKPRTDNVKISETSFRKFKKKFGKKFGDDSLNKKNSYLENGKLYFLSKIFHDKKHNDSLNNKIIKFLKNLNKENEENQNSFPKKRKIDHLNESSKKTVRTFEKHKRRNIRKAELWTVLIRQKFVCNICKNMFNCPPIMDHIIPLEIGGNYKINNLQGICALCNSWKSGMYDKQIKGMMKYNKMTPEEILLIQKKVYDDKFNSNQKQSIKISNSTVNIFNR